VVSVAPVVIGITAVRIIVSVGITATFRPKFGIFIIFIINGDVTVIVISFIIIFILVIIPSPVISNTMHGL
jgi:hypothetical protein